MDISKEFDAVFNDIIGKLDIPEEVKASILPKDRMKEFYSDLVKFAEHILHDDKLHMYGIHHALHYVAAKKADYERGVKHKCPCGKEYSIRVWNDAHMLSVDRSLRESLTRSGNLYFSPESYRDVLMDQRFCAFCGRAFRTEGIIISMKCEMGVEIE